MVPVIIPDDELVSVKRAARELDLSPQSILNAIRRGELTARDADGRFVMRRCDIDAFRNNRRRRLIEKRERRTARGAV